ncbi:Cytochrome b-c1 complex subunit 9 [Apostasia shenzhenica]|uniref:Cytochrome b-c1 complex subunit 9 n=1 Tax=Apostasia shenzhenica TaxID=1088818 RepID=A0A2I0B3K5_9ASPA|nr:Cytochrome b-c1 complex subunit 9 [Apostasia shenzhenica]
MDSTARRGGGGLWEGLYRLLMRRNSVYVTFIVAGAFAGERGFFRISMFWDRLLVSGLLEALDFLFFEDMVDLFYYGVHRLWEYNNTGKRYEDIPVLGQRTSE